MSIAAFVGMVGGASWGLHTYVLAPVTKVELTKDLTTGSIAEPKPTPAPQPAPDARPKTAPTPDPGRRGRCVSETSPAEVMKAVAGDDDPPAKFKQRFAGQRLCTPWTLYLWAVTKQDDGSWRAVFHTGTLGLGVQVHAATRADPSAMEGKTVRVEGTLDHRDPPSLMRLGGVVYLMNARISP